MYNRHFYLLFLFAAIFGFVVVVVVIFHFNNILRLLWLVVESCLLLLRFRLILLSPQPRDFPFKHFDTVDTLGYQSLFPSHFLTLLTSLISHSAQMTLPGLFNVQIVSPNFCPDESALRKFLLYAHMLTPRAPDTDWAGPGSEWRESRRQHRWSQTQGRQHYTQVQHRPTVVFHYSLPITDVDRSMQKT